MSRRGACDTPPRRTRRGERGQGGRGGGRNSACGGKAGRRMEVENRSEKAHCLQIFCTHEMRETANENHSTAHKTRDTAVPQQGADRHRGGAACPEAAGSRSRRQRMTQSWELGPPAAPGRIPTRSKAAELSTAAKPHTPCRTRTARRSVPTSAVLTRPISFKALFAPSTQGASRARAANGRCWKRGRSWRNLHPPSVAPRCRACG